MSKERIAYQQIECFECPTAGCESCLPVADADDRRAAGSGQFEHGVRVVAVLPAEVVVAKRMMGY